MHDRFLVISTSRRIDYAYGYLALGLLDDAAKELGAVARSDRRQPPVLAARVDLHMAAKAWAEVAECARRLTELTPGDPNGWISWAYATRRLVDIPSAEKILVQGETQVGRQCPTIDYNLACYYCLLGEVAKAKQRLEKACGADPAWKQAALADEDLRTMWAEIALML
jgi:tetratricopeptide (TPR) repeat protein